MQGLLKPTARYLILSVAGVYILLLEYPTGALDPWPLGKPTKKATTLGSLAVETVTGFYLAFRPHHT